MTVLEKTEKNAVKTEQEGAEMEQKFREEERAAQRLRPSKEGRLLRTADSKSEQPPVPILSVPLPSSQPQLIPPKPSATGTIFSPPKYFRPSPPKLASGKGFLSNFTTNSGKRGFCFPTHRSSSEPSRSDAGEATKRQIPRSLPEERSLAATTSPKAAFYKISLLPRQKPLRVIVLGQSGVGKTALVVRFITKRYIGEYDPSLEKVYTFQTIVDEESVCFEILDTAGQPYEAEHLTLEANIRWAEAYILMYSVTDKCSFDECSRLKFLVNYNRRRRRLVSSSSKDHTSADIPVLLIGNKIDQSGDRMISSEEGRRKSREIGCVCFHEISVRESVDQVLAVFRDTCRFWRDHARYPKLKRSSSDVRGDILLSPENFLPSYKSLWHDTSSSTSPLTSGSSWSESSDVSLLKEVDEENEQTQPFRGRAQTDGHLLSRPRLWKFPPPAPSSFSQLPLHHRGERRMSISMRGNNASC